MKIKINNANPILHKNSDLHYSVKVWNVTGTFIKEDCNCAHLSQPFDIYVYLPGLNVSKQEIYQLTKNKLQEDGEIV